MPQIFASTNDVSVRTKYVKGSLTAQIAAEKTAFGICAAKTAQWIANMKKIGADPSERDLARTDPGSGGDVAILQSLFGMKYEKTREEDTCISWLAKQRQWSVERGVVKPLDSIFDLMKNDINVPGEWMLVAEGPPPKSERHAIGVATRKVNGVVVFLVYDPNRGLFQFDEKMAKMNLGLCWYSGWRWKAFRNNINDD